MTTALFVPQSTLEDWLDLEGIAVAGHTLHYLDDASVYQLEPAFHITKVVDGDDSLNLRGKTCTLTELDNAQADCFRTSIVLANTAYDCEEGFVVTRSREN
tara:strand:+ start:753 stop:1055 length:303 start_codon:yes stop_codon:yes gene_type:complete